MLQQTEAWPIELIPELLKTTQWLDNEGDIWWRVTNQGVHFFAQCSDLFFWGTADMEGIAPTDLPLLKEYIQIMEDTLGPKVCRANGWKYTGEDCYVYQYFCARKRGMRPQQPVIARSSERLQKLYNDCGPERDPKSEG